MLGGQEDALSLCGGSLPQHALAQLGIVNRTQPLPWSIAVGSAPEP